MGGVVLRVMKRLEWGRTTLEILFTFPRKAPDQMSTANASVAESACELFGIIISLTLIVIVWGRAALLMARTAVLPLAVGFLHMPDGGPCTSLTPKKPKSPLTKLSVPLARSVTLVAEVPHPSNETIG